MESVTNNMDEAPAARPANDQPADAPNPLAVNAEYNRASLDWIELRLRRLADRSEGETPGRAQSFVSSDACLSVDFKAGEKRAEPEPIQPPPPRPFWRFWERAVAHTPSTARQTPPKGQPQPASAPLALPPGPGSVTDEQVARAVRNREEAAQGVNSTPAAIRIAERFGLSDFERDTLLLCAAPEMRPGFTLLCDRTNAAIGLRNSPFPTFAIALAALSDDSAWDVVSPERPLRYWRLIEINQNSTQPLNAGALRAEERVVNALNGLDYLDDRLAPYIKAFEPPSEELPASQQETLAEIVRAWQRAAGAGFLRGVPHVVQLLGPESPTKARLSAHAAAALGRTLYLLPVEQLPASGPELESFARLFLRESILLPIALYLDAHRGLESGGPDSARAASLRRFLSQVEGAAVFLGIREAWEREGRSDIIVEANLPTTAEQRDAWAAALGPDAVDVPGRLAAQFHLDAPEIASLAQESFREVEQTGLPLAEVLWNACRDRVRPRLDTMAQRIEARAGLDDLVLPEEPFALIHQIAAQVGQRSRVYTDWGFADRGERGLGISVLFAGESGTGKTMAAEALANHLGLSLYRIDLSSVVSKYIGETEENLRKVFDAAEEGGVVLFFDEADALFGKRTEVKDSHDRYANIEVNYLLQRMEAYQGLAILASNRKSAIDAAFMRRLRFIVQFPFPGIAERKRIWQKAFPGGTPVDGLDYDRLSRMALTGGNIASVSLNAAFLAADAQTPVTMPLILRAARTEFLKLERPINEADFRL